MADIHPGPLISLWAPVSVLSDRMHWLARERTEGCGEDRDEIRAKYADEAIAEADRITALIQNGAAENLSALSGQDRKAWGFSLADTVRQLGLLVHVIADRQFDGHEVTELGLLLGKLDVALGELDTARAVYAPRKPAGPTGRPLTEREQLVLDYIRENGPVSGKEICSKFHIEQGSLTSQVIPNLKLHGVENRRGAGYFIAKQ